MSIGRNSDGAPDGDPTEVLLPFTCNTTSEDWLTPVVWPDANGLPKCDGLFADVGSTRYPDVPEYAPKPVSNAFTSAMIVRGDSEIATMSTIAVIPLNGA